MKKLLLALIAVAAFIALDADARCCKRVARSCEQRSCKTACTENVKEMPPRPCCVRFVRVEEPAQLHKEVEYSWSCPSNCQQEQTQGYMLEGENSLPFETKSYNE